MIVKRFTLGSACLFVSVSACAEAQVSPPVPVESAALAVDAPNGIPKYADWTEIPKPGEFYLLAVKNKNRLSVNSLTQPGKVYKTFHAISGTKSGDKEREGDMKTPEGIYFVERRIPQSRMRALHGAAAFELNYPNPVDQILRRTGHGIWIHGVDNEGRLSKRFDTLGCVAVSNPDISDIGEKLVMKNTPIVIVDEEKTTEPIGVETGDSPLFKRVFDWAAAWSSRDVEAYLAFYDDSFKSRNMDKAAWNKYKTRLSKTYKSISVTISDLKILRHGKYSVAVFKQEYESDRFTSTSLKRLYLAGLGENAKILAEEVAEEVGPGKVLEPPPASSQVSVGIAQPASVSQ